MSIGGPHEVLPSHAEQDESDAKIEERYTVERSPAALTSVSGRWCH